MINYLNQGVPILAAIWVTQDFMNSTTGIIPNPTSASDFLDRTSKEPLGGHAVFIAGYIP